MLDIEAIRKRCEAATEGPWKPTHLDHSGFRHVDGKQVYDPAWMVFEAMQLGDGQCGSMLQADAEFIAASRQDIPALLAEVERLQKENESLHAAQEAQVANDESLRRLWG